MKTVSLTICICTVFVIGLLANAQNKQGLETRANENPLAGKVVILNPTSITLPHANARIEELGGKKFLVYPVQQEDGASGESWTAIDDISRILTFKSMEDAEAYIKNAKQKS